MARQVELSSPLVPIGTELHRSESLTLVQLLILYHLVTATASVAVGGDGGRHADGVREPPLPATYA